MPRRGNAERAIVVHKAAPPPAAPPPRPSPAIAAAGRAAESVVVAIVASTGLYLVGSVYTDAFFGRLSIDSTSLDLPPPYVALQSVHALRGLLEFPATLLVLYVLYRTFAAPARRLRPWLERLRRRFPRLLPIVANLIVIAPLAAGALAISIQEEGVVQRSVLSEVASLLGNATIALLAYAIWLGWSQRRFLVSEIIARKPIPIALVFAVYLLTVLGSSAIAAELAAELLLTGSSDASLRITFAPKPGAPPVLPGQQLLLVTARNGAYYVVAQEAWPPSQRPVSYVIPFGSIESARVQRLNDADVIPIGLDE